MKVLWSGLSVCHAGTRPGAFRRRRRTGPRIVARTLDQPGFHRVGFDIRDNPLELVHIPDPMIVALGLPERLPGAAQDPIPFTGGGALQRSQQAGRRDQRQQQDVDVIGHHNPGLKPVMSQFHPAPQRGHDGSGDRFLAQIKRSVPGRVEVAIHPHEGFARAEVRGWRIPGTRKASVQMPGNEEPAARRVAMRETARILHTDTVDSDRGILGKMTQAPWSGLSVCHAGTHPAAFSRAHTDTVAADSGILDKMARGKHRDESRRGRLKVRSTMIAALLACCFSLSAQTLDRAEALWKARRYQDANEVFKVLVAREPKNAHYRVRWGRLYLEHWQPGEADGLFNEAIAIDPNSAEAVMGKALVAEDSFEGEAAGLAPRALPRPQMMPPTRTTAKVRSNHQPWLKHDERTLRIDSPPEIAPWPL